MMGLLAARQERRRRQGLAERYVAALLRPPSAADVAWLSVAGGGFPDRCARELAFAQRAIGLIVSERDALDDQTAADVSHALNAVVSRESSERRGEVAEWSAHWREYADAMATRGRAEPPLGRIARVLLRRVGVAEPNIEQVARGVSIVTAIRHAANDVLREVYGSATLPEDRPPSALARDRSGHG